MKKTLRSQGLREPPSWVQERMPDRPDWRCRSGPERERFKEFVFEDLALRFTQTGARNVELTKGFGAPPPTDRRRKPDHVRALDPVELAANAVPLIREIFEDYWAGLYRGHDPSAEEMAAEFGGVSVQEVEQRLKRSKARRPHLK